MMNILLANEADKNLEDIEGLNCFDLAVIGLQYEAAYYLFTKQGMTRSFEERDRIYGKREHEFDQDKVYRREFDVDLFFLMLEQGRETCEDKDIFFEKKRREYQEWLQRDLVIDTRESWRDWIKR